MLSSKGPPLEDNIKDEAIPQNNQLIDKSSLRISPAGNIYNTAPAPTKEETLTINWVGSNVGIVISEL